MPTKLRERVYSGKGVIASLWDNMEDSFLGVQANDTLPAKDILVDFLESPVFTGKMVPSVGEMLKIEKFNDKNLLASAIASNGIKYPAVVQNHYGLGKTLFFAFDIVRSLQQDSNAQWVNILTQALNHVHRPQVLKDFYAFDFVPIEIQMKSSGKAEDQKLTEIYHSEIKLWDSSSNKWIIENPWEREIHIGADKKGVLSFLVMLPNIKNEYVLTVDVSRRVDDEWVSTQSHSLDLTVKRDVPALLDHISEILAHLTPMDNYDIAQIARAKEAILNIKERMNQQGFDVQLNISDILDAIKAIKQIKPVK